MTCYNRQVDETTGADDGIVEQVRARAAFAGNPSDGYSGAVFAVPVDAYQATVTVRRVPSWSVSDDISGGRVFSDAATLQRSIRDAAAAEPHGLVLASLGAFIAHSGLQLPPLSIDVSSTIPASVGLAGSSAIVIAALRALHRVTRTTLPPHLALAHLARDVETQRLGITAGLQDRMVQIHGRPVLMRFDQRAPVGASNDRGSVQVIEPGADLRIMVAHRLDLAEPSHIVHGDLRRRFDRGDAAVRAAMGQLAAHAIDAARAFAAGDALGLGASMDATFDLRAQMIDLVPGHVEMVETARSNGASANFTGSGGSIVVLSRDDDIEHAARHSLKRLGCEIVSADISGDTFGSARVSSD